MSLVHYEPWALAPRFHSNLADLCCQANVDTKEWRPSVDIKEEVDHFAIKADLPGVDPKDIEIATEDGVLSISGERHLTHKEQEKDYTHMERIDGYFSRKFSLPDNVDTSSIKAKSKHGVLEISIPKKAKTKPKTIRIQEEK